MSNHSDLDDFLRTDPRDGGCDRAREMLHVYAELFLIDPVAAADRYPEVETHLAACGPCEDDLQGLLAAIAASGDC